MKNKCRSCDRMTIAEVCRGCQKKENVNEKKVELKKDFRDGLCYFSADGEFCPLPGGVIDGQKNYCSYHAREKNFAEGKKIILWARENLREIILTRKFAVYNDYPAVGKKVTAIVPEWAINNHWIN